MNDAEEEDHNPPNPFSFSSFLTHNPTDSTSAARTQDTEDYKNVNSRKTKQTLVVLDEDEALEENNPFSFKAFVNPLKNNPSNDINASVEATPLLLENQDSIDRILNLDLNSVSELFSQETSSETSNDLQTSSSKSLSNENISTEKECLFDKLIKKQKEQLKMQAEKIIKMEQEIISLKSREAEETVALEKIVQHVEKNLEITTARAVSAECQVSKLKQDVKALQIQLKSAEDEVLKANFTREATCSKAEGIALNLRSAAQDAEVNLKNLLNGTEKLKLLSDLVISVTKVTEER